MWKQQHGAAAVRQCCPQIIGPFDANNFRVQSLGLPHPCPAKFKNTQIQFIDAASRKLDALVIRPVGKTDGKIAFGHFANSAVGLPHEPRGCAGQAIDQTLRQRGQNMKQCSTQILSGRTNRATLYEISSLECATSAANPYLYKSMLVCSPLDSLDDKPLRFGSVEPIANLDPFSSFEVFVMLEEMLDLLQCNLWQVRGIQYAVITFC